jgi:hypothetical protein
VLCELFPCLSHRPLSSIAGYSPIEESGPEIKACAYVGISGK